MFRHVLCARDVLRVQKTQNNQSRVPLDPGWQRYKDAGLHNSNQQDQIVPSHIGPEDFTAEDLESYVLADRKTESPVS